MEAGFEFDLILGMDWLSKHRAMVDCDKNIAMLKCPHLSEVTVHGIRSEPIPKVISAMEARRFLRKGCEAFLVFILDSKKEQVNFENIPVIREFPNVFPEELPGYHMKEKWISLLKLYKERLVFRGYHPTVWLQLN